MKTVLYDTDKHKIIQTLDYLPMGMKIIKLSTKKLWVPYMTVLMTDEPEHYYKITGWHLPAFDYKFYPEFIDE
jgi:hypothetical protein